MRIKIFEIPNQGHVRKDMISLIFNNFQLEITFEYERRKTDYPLHSITSMLFLH